MGYREFLGKLEEIIIEDKGNRGLGEVAKTGDISGAIEELYHSSSVMIVTGFCIKKAMVGETDGPIGAVSLGRALLKLGKEIVFVTDIYSQHLLKAALDVLKIEAPVEIVAFEEAEEFCKNIVNKYLPSHIVAVERPGRAEDGRCYSMGGEDISSVVPNTDPLLKRSEELSIVTIAIGDGGNEVGMGKIKELIVQSAPEGKTRLAVVKSDYLIVAGVSNWGAHGLVAGLSFLAAKRLLHDEAVEKSLLKAIVEAGAVDGCSKKSEMTVDGLSLEINLNIVKALNNLIRTSMENHADEIIDLRLVKHG